MRSSVITLFSFCSLPPRWPPPSPPSLLAFSLMFRSMQEAFTALLQQSGLLQDRGQQQSAGDGSVARNNATMELPVVDIEPFLKRRTKANSAIECELPVSTTVGDVDGIVGGDEFFHKLDLDEDLKLSCEKVAACLRETGALVIRDPRCTTQDNDRFLDMMERYFGQAADLKRKQERPDLHYQVGFVVVWFGLQWFGLVCRLCNLWRHFVSSLRYTRFECRMGLQNFGISSRMCADYGVFQ